jgi:hypothetical protein
MPGGTISHTTLAVNSLGGSEETTYHTFRVPATSLRNGRNVIAVSVHQSGRSSSDLNFDLELKGETSTSSAMAMRSAGTYNNSLDLMSTTGQEGVDLMSSQNAKSGIKVNSLKNYPNPFQQQTTIEFSVAENANAVVQIYTMQGALVTTLYNAKAEAGKIYKLNFNGGNLASGVYICKLIYNQQVLQQKITLVR